MKLSNNKNLTCIEMYIVPMFLSSGIFKTSLLQYAYYYFYYFACGKNEAQETLAEDVTNGNNKTRI